MITFVNGMAVLILRFLFVLLSYQVIKQINWKKILLPHPTDYSLWLSALLSIGVGYLVSSFFLEIIQLLQNMILSTFYY